MSAKIQKMLNPVRPLCVRIGLAPGWLMAVSNFVIIAAILSGYWANNLAWAFRETGFATYYSGIQIILISASCYFISELNQRDSDSEKPHKRIWKIASIGFFYLFLDEVAQLHEKIDFSIHYIFSIDASGTTDMIDDVILLGMILFAGGYLLRNARVFLSEYGYRKTYTVAFLLLVLMVAVDVLFSGIVDFSEILHSSADLNRAFSIAFVLEDSLKIWGGSFLLIAISGTLAQLRSQDLANKKPASVTP